MGTFSAWHWVIVLAVVVLLFGGRKLPELASGLGKSIKNFKKEMQDGEGEQNAGAAGDGAGANTAGSAGANGGVAGNLANNASANGANSNSATTNAAQNERV